MRYLWVEDFDGGRSGQEELKKNLMNYFQLEDSMISQECHTLKSVLEFLEDKSKWSLFDAILIDIRFKIGENNKDEDEIYEKYFCSFLTKERYQYYAQEINGDVNAASSGILLYLALIYRYNYNQNRIVFLSANVDQENRISVKIPEIIEMRELLKKAKRIMLSQADKDVFSTENNDLFEKYQAMFGYTEEEADEKFPIPKVEEIDWKDEECLNLIEEQLNKLEKEMQENFSYNVVDKNDNKLKYNSINEEFEKIGLKMSQAFKKPEGGDSKAISWEFIDWKENLMKNSYYKLRSHIVPICLEVLEAIENDYETNPTYFKLCQPYKQLIVKEDNEEGSIKDDIKHLFSNILIFFPENVWLKDDGVLYSQIIGECVSLCDKIEKKKIEKTSGAVLKITRNWIFHQGIEGIQAFDVVFIFHILIHTFLDMSNLQSMIGLDKKMIKDFSDLDSELAKDEMDAIINNCIKKCRMKNEESYKKFKDNKTEEELKRVSRKYFEPNENTNLYDTISGIGNELSPIKDTVSMSLLYILYLENAKKESNEFYKIPFNTDVIRRVEDEYKQD